MKDNEILTLYYNRDESAITATASKYGNYCTKIAMNILQNNQDSDECVNDTWLKAWNAIPPQEPTVLASFLGKITRNLSLNRYNAAKSKKHMPLLLDELSDCITNSRSLEDDFDIRETGKTISDFLRSIDEEPRLIFVRRYWYTDSIAEIAVQFNMSQSKVKSMLLRTRNKMKLYLQERGINT
jgi:RNA polymerase sigma-70 factor (ECF subfamily)